MNTLVSREDFVELGIEDAWDKFRDMKSTPKEKNLTSKIFEYYGITLDNVKKKTRKPNHVKAKRLYCYLAYEVLNTPIFGAKRSLQDVATDIGLVNHATVIHHIGVFKSLIESSEEYRLEIIDFANMYLTQESSEKLKTKLSKIKGISFSRLRENRVIQSSKRKFIKFR